MADLARNDRYCIIGAGASGLAVAKNFDQRGIPFDCLEREAEHRRALEHRHRKRHRLRDHAPGVLHLLHRLTTTCRCWTRTIPSIPATSACSAISATTCDDVRPGRRTSSSARRHARRAARATSCGRWPSPARTAPRIYRGVVVASGHHDVPRMPAYPGTFTGETLHSRRYKSPRQVRDKRVLVVGCGNSAADIVSDAVHGGSQVFLSLRRGYWFVPKFMLGFPTDDVVSGVEMLAAAAAREALAVPGQPVAAAGAAVALPLPDPDYAIDQAHPTMTRRDPAPRRARTLTVKPEIAGYDGKPRAVQGRHGRDDRHHRVRHRLSSRSCRSSTRA